VGSAGNTVAALEPGERAVATARSVESLNEMQKQYLERNLALALDVTDRRSVFEVVAQGVEHFTPGSGGRRRRI
jgi:NADP-dependent 3-hydroxy acid dehydrogenase YdfG